MKSSALFITGLVTLFVLTISLKQGYASPANTASDEPDRVAFLIIDGQNHEVLLNENSTVTIDGKPHQVEVRLASTRVFDQAGIQFAFPSDMHFSFEEAENSLNMWTMDGNAAVIMVHEYSARVEAEDIIDGMKSQYVGMNTEFTTAPSKIEYPGGLLEGQQFDLRFGSSPLFQNVFSVQSENRTAVIILQDSLQDDGSHTDEYQRIADAFGKTFATASETSGLKTRRAPR